MNLSFSVLLIAVSVSSVACWTVFPLSGKLKEANSKPSVSPPVPAVTTTSTVSPSRFPAPVQQTTSSFNKPSGISSFNKPSGVSGIAAPSKDLLPPKESSGITTPVKPSLFSAPLIQTPPKVPSVTTTKRPTIVLSRTTNSFKPLSTNPVKRTVVELLTPKIFTNSVSKTQIEPITTITNEDDSETINKKSVMEIEEMSTLLTPVDTTNTNDTASVFNTDGQSGDLKGIDAGKTIEGPVSEATSQATTSTTLEPTLPTTFTIASTSSSTQFIQSSTSEDDSSSVEIITSPSIESSIPKKETATKLLTRVDEEKENPSPVSTTISLVTSSSPSPSISSPESETLTTVSVNVEQPSIHVTQSTERSSSESSPASILTSSPSSLTTVSSSSEVDTASLAHNVLIAAVEQPSTDLLPPKEVAVVVQNERFFPFEPIYVELVPPKEEYTSVYETSAAQTLLKST